MSLRETATLELEHIHIYIQASQLHSAQPSALHRIFFCRHSGTKTEVINMGSYNYLGFAENTGPCCAASKNAILKNGIGIGSSRHGIGSSHFFVDGEFQGALPV